MHLKVKPSTDGSGFDIPDNVNLCNLPPGILPGDLEGVPEDILRENFPEIFQVRTQINIHESSHYV